MTGPVTRTLDSRAAARARELFTRRGHTLRSNPKNPYVAFEVRTDGRSIFTLYTSGKLVSTVREGDAEALLLEGELGAIGGAPAARAAARPTPVRAARDGIRWVAGADETGTGELIGRALLGGALHPVGLGESLARIAGRVETKVGRAASGWADLARRLRELRGEGLSLVTVAVPNRLFDTYSKNALLDLAYVRLAGDLWAAGGLDPRADLPGVELVIDDYGAGALLHAAAGRWRRAGLRLAIETKADDSHLAVRAASVHARAQRSREMTGLAAESADALGTGNAGDRVTLAWLRHHRPPDGRWPPFVKASFRTVRDIDRLPPVRKEPLPRLEELLDEVGVEGLLDARLDVSAAHLCDAAGAPRRSFAVGVEGALRAAPCRAFDFAPLLCGGLVLADDVCDLDRVERMLVRGGGLLDGWRVLVGPDEDGDDPVLVALARAHRAGIVDVVPTDERDPHARALRHAALLVTARARAPVLALRVVD